MTRVTAAAFAVLLVSAGVAHAQQVPDVLELRGLARVHARGSCIANNLITEAAVSTRSQAGTTSEDSEELSPRLKRRCERRVRKLCNKVCRYAEAAMEVCDICKREVCMLEDTPPPPPPPPSDTCALGDLVVDDSVFVELTFRQVVPPCELRLLQGTNEVFHGTCAPPMRLPALSDDEKLGFIPFVVADQSDNNHAHFPTSFGVVNGMLVVDARVILLAPVPAEQPVKGLRAQFAYTVGRAGFGVGFRWAAPWQLGPFPATTHTCTYSGTLELGETGEGR
jgi:hypothetical protein